MRPFDVKHGRVVAFEVAMPSDDTSDHVIIWASHEDGQLDLIDSFQPGPFDTRLEVAQRVWRTISRAMPPLVR